MSKRTFGYFVGAMMFAAGPFLLFSCSPVKPAFELAKNGGRTPGGSFPNTPAILGEFYDDGFFPEMQKLLGEAVAAANPVSAGHTVSWVRNTKSGDVRGFHGQVIFALRT